MTASAISKTELAARILQLPAGRRARAIHHLQLIRTALEKPGAKAHAARNHLERRRYANDPWAYFADVIGVWLTPDQEAVLELLNRETRVLIPSANNAGKTFLLAGWGLYCFDARGSLEGDGEREQGARILLPGPDHATVFETIYSEMLSLARRAEIRGHLMPGDRSELSVNWRVRPKWSIEAFSPPKNKQQNVAHTASGRHHRNQVALIEEGQGVPEPVWKATEGMCSSEGNQIASSFNPTEAVGPTYQRAQAGEYSVMHLSSFNHPNVLLRKNKVIDAVDFVRIDRRVKTQCRDRGPWPQTIPEPEFLDFVYALPPSRHAPERGPREDGQLGHADGELRVYRPNGTFTAQVLGQWPTSSEAGLFSSAQWDMGVGRWKQRVDPAEPPDRVGIDVAREGTDETIAAPRWGESAEQLLRDYAALQEEIEEGREGAEAIDMLRAARRIRSGELRVVPKGDGVDVAQWIDHAFPESPLAIDELGVGTSPYDHLNRVLRRDVLGIAVSKNAEPPLPGEPFCENLRTQLYVRAAMLVNRGLADLPDDPILREEIFAHELLFRRKTLKRSDPKTGFMRSERVEVVLLIPKEEVKAKIGRSPDRAEAWVISLVGDPPTRGPQPFMATSQSYYSI